MVAPALAGSASTMHVGLTLTGDFATALAGGWHARGAADGAIYHFVVRGSSGALYQHVSVPVRGRGTCDLRLSGVIYSLEPVSGQRSRYEMQYAIQSADVITSSSSGGCSDVADAYLNDVPGAQSLILSRAGEGRLIDSATGVEYARTR
jgi:hypothetical protein